MNYSYTGQAHDNAESQLSCMQLKPRRSQVNASQCTSKDFAFEWRMLELIIIIELYFTTRIPYT